MAGDSDLASNIVSVGMVAQLVADSIGKVLASIPPPEELLRIYNEISEVRVLMAVAERAVSKLEDGSKNTVQRFCRLLSRIEKLLQTFQDIASKILTTSTPGYRGDGIQDRNAPWSTWRLESTEVRQLTAKLSEVRQSIRYILIPNSETDFPKTAVSVENVSFVQKENFPPAPQSSTTAEYTNPEEISRGMQNLVITASTYADPGLNRQLLYDIEDEDAMFQKELEVQSIVHLPRTQLDVCHCKCHASLNISSPWWLGAAIGRLLVHYSAGTTAQKCSKCSSKSCRGNTRNTIRSVYYFPGWIMRRMISIQMSWNHVYGLDTLTLTAPRVISTNSSVFLFAQHGNIEAMQRLFSENLASPFDISLEEGRSPLHFAVTAVKPRMISFLLKQGADPQLEDKNQLTAHDVVWNYFMQNPGDSSIEELMESAGLTPSDTDSLEKRRFTIIHRIVLGLSSLDLRAYLEENSSEINEPDVYGKTPLCWAASRPDTGIVEVLLEYGASLTLSDHRKQTPIHYCAGSGHHRTMKVLLEAAVKYVERSSENEASSLKTKSFQARPSSMTTPTRKTIDISHIVDARDSKGRTPLNFATRMNFPIHTRLLISYGADIECPDTVLGRTILLFNVYWNSHKILPILLENGAKTNVLDSRNASLLHYAARFADLETLKILAAANLGRLDSRSHDDTGNSPLEIFNNPFERCVAERGRERQEAEQTFRAILEQASGEFTWQPAGRIIEMAEESGIIVNSENNVSGHGFGDDSETEEHYTNESSPVDEWFDALPNFE